MLQRFSIPLWALQTTQCVLTVIIFIIVLMTFTVQMKQSIQDEVLLRVQDRIEGVRRVLLEPFVEGYEAIETLSTMSNADPYKYQPSDNESAANDVEHFRYAGSTVQSSTSIIYICQVFESKNAPLDTNGYPFATVQLTSRNVDAKAFAGRYNYFHKQAWQVNDTIYASQPISYQGSFSTSNIPMTDTRLNDTARRMYWTNYPITYTYNVQETIINSTTGLPETIQVEMVAFTKMAMFSSLQGAMGQGLRLYNNWMLMSIVDLRSVEPLLLSLTDEAKGETDSYSALYDISAENFKDYKVMAASHPLQIDVVNTTDMTYFSATESSSSALNKWFKDALAFSQNAGTEQGAFHTQDRRFLSFAHIRHSESNLHLFAIVSTADYKYFTEVNKLQRTMVGIGVACAVLVVSLGFLIIYFVSVPIRGLKKSMGYAATLQNEKVVSARSFLSEIDSLCVAFSKMNIMLTEAKTYMPASMLIKFSADSSGSADEDEDVELVESRREVSVLKNSVHTLTASQASRRASQSYVDGAQEQTTTSGPPRVAEGLKNRRVGILCVNVRGFTSIRDFAITNISTHSTSLLDVIAQATSSEGGVIDSFHGDNFMVCFNAVKSVGTPGGRAVQCASAIHHALADTPYRRLSMGVGCGQAVVGPLGNTSQRRMSIIGDCYTKAIRLQKVAAALERSLEPLFGEQNKSLVNCFHVLIDPTTKAECGELIDSLLVGLLKETNGKASKARFGYRHSSTVGITLMQLKSLQQPTALPSLNNQIHAVVFDMGAKGGKKGNDDEWMYEIHQMSLRNPFRLANEAMEAAMAGNTEDVLRAARDRNVHFLEDTSATGPCIASVHTSLITYLERVVKCESSPSVAELGSVAFRRPEDIVIDFSLIAENGEQVESERLLSSFVRSDAPTATTQDEEISESNNTALNLQLKAVPSSFQIAELAEWLRLAYLLDLGKHDHFLDSVTYV